MKLLKARLGMPAMLATALIVSSMPSYAQDSVDAADPTPEQAQAYQDAQGCTLVLEAAGGEANEALAKIALEKARNLAAVNGDDTDEKFAKSMSDWDEILKMASAEEASQFLSNCQQGLAA